MSIAARDAGVAALLGALVEIPSPNPDGDTTAIARFVADWMERETGASVLVVAPPAKPEAESVVARVGTGDGPVIMLHAHIDTVPVAPTEAAAWSSDPFKADVRDGRLYGKGAVDDKGVLAAMMCAVRRAVMAQQARGTILLVAAAEEEVGGQLGTRWLNEQGLLPTCDFVVVGEQTDNLPGAAHKGVMRASVTVRGRSTHATNPDRGVSAITAMARIVSALESYHHGLASRVHPLAGSPTCNVGTIVGGSTTNAVPDTCTITIDRRMIPRESPEEVQAELQRVVAAVDVAPAVVEVHGFLASSWFESALDGPAGRAFLDVISTVKGTTVQPVGYLPGSDAKHLLDVGRDGMVVFGPGTYEVAHAADEFVPIAALEEAETILATFLATMYGGVE